MLAATKSDVAESTASGESVAARFAIGAFWALAGAVVSRGLTLASAVIAGRMLGTAGFGEVGMIQSTQGLFGMLAGAGLGLAATKFVAEFHSTDAARAGRCVRLATTIAWISGTIVAIALFFMSGPIAATVLSAPHLTLELQVATGLVLFCTINGVQTGALVGFGEFRSIAVLNSIRGACLCGLLVAGIALGDVLGGVIGLVVTEAIAVATNHVVLRRLLLDSQSHRGDGWRDLAAMCRFSILSLLGSVCLMSAMWFANIVLVSQPDGYASLGVFTAADRWRLLLLFLPASFSPLILSTLSNLHGRNNPAAYRQIFGLNLWVSVGVVLVPSLGVIACAPLAMSLYGDDYRDGGMTLVILAASAIPMVLNNLLGQILVSKGAILGRFLLDVLLSAVLALASWQLIPMYRDQGMALGSLIAYGLTALALVAPAIYYMKNVAAGERTGVEPSFEATAGK